VQMVCALVKPTIMARKMVRASRGTDPKLPAEPRRAESRHDREAARAHIVSAACAKGKKRAIVLGTRSLIRRRYSTVPVKRHRGEPGPVKRHRGEPGQYR
jgi:hypothetical protein